MEEIWKDIEGYEGKYQVSNTGKVRSLNFNNSHKIQELKQKINRYGYYEVKLSKNNKTKDFLVSTLVAKAFISNKNIDKEVMHIGDTKDNNIENLRFGYRSQILHLTYRKKKREGKASGNKFSYKGKGYKSLKDLADKKNISYNVLIERIFKGWTLTESVEIPKDRLEKKLNISLYKYNNQIYSINQIVDKFNINEKTLRGRLKRGWSIEEAIEIPVGKRNKEE